LTVDRHPPRVGDVIDARYELVRDLGGERVGRVFAARDRPLGRDVALRVVDAADSAKVEALRRESRRMSAVMFDCAQAVQVLDEGTGPEGTAYVAMELVSGMTLEQLARRRRPLPAHEVARYGAEMLDACVAAERSSRTRIAVVPGSAVVTHDGHVKMTSFVEVPADPTGADPACREVAEELRRLVEGADEPPELEHLIEQALSGRITRSTELRDRLQHLARAPAPVPVPVPDRAPARRVWPLVLVSIGILVAIALLALIPVFLGGS
jgi:hypothetical protein